MPEQFGYKDPNRKRGTVGKDDPFDQFMRPLVGGDDPYSTAAREGYEDLEGQALPDINTYGARGAELEQSLNAAAMGELQEGRERGTQAISASYARRGLGGQGAGTAQISQSEGASLAHAAEIAAKNRAYAKQRYEDLGLQERGRELSRRQFAQQLMYQNKPGENQILPTMIGLGADIGGQMLGGWAQGGFKNPFGGGGMGNQNATVPGAGSGNPMAPWYMGGQAGMEGPGLVGPDVGSQFEGGTDHSPFGPVGAAGYPDEMEGPRQSLKEGGAPMGPYPDAMYDIGAGGGNDIAGDPYGQMARDEYHSKLREFLYPRGMTGRR